MDDFLETASTAGKDGLVGKACWKVVLVYFHVYMILILSRVNLLAIIFIYLFLVNLFIILFYASFSHQRWSPSDDKCPQVSRTLLSILADLNNAVVRMISILSASFFFFLKPLGTVHQLQLLSVAFWLVNACNIK